nr:aminoacyl-tRNA hydrolase [Motilibacter rhizosphaerae]
MGLGNPGEEYAATRHNAGYLVVDALAARAGGRFGASRRVRADVVEGRIAGPGSLRVVLAKPHTYMNESGGPAAALRDFYGVPVERTVVVHDELDLPFAALRCKLGGGDNGHNGLKSLRRSLGGGEFYRVRVGIGRPPGRQDPADFVLKPWSSTERKELDLLVERAADCVEALVTEGLERAQQQFND